MRWPFLKRQWFGIFIFLILLQTKLNFEIENHWSLNYYGGRVKRSFLVGSWKPTDTRGSTHYYGGREGATTTLHTLTAIEIMKGESPTQISSFADFVRCRRFREFRHSHANCINPFKKSQFEPNCSEPSDILRKWPSGNNDTLQHCICIEWYSMALRGPILITIYVKVVLTQGS